MKRIIYLAAAVLMLAACNGSKTTTVVGIVPDGKFATVRIVVEENNIDQVVNVVKGKFKAVVPTNLLAVGKIQADMTTALFVPDGTKIKLDYSNQENLYAVSKKGTRSVNNQYLEMQKWESKFINEYMKLQSKDTKEEALKLYGDYFKEKAKKFNNSIVAVYSIVSGYSVWSEDELKDVLGSVSVDVLKQKDVQSIKAALEKKAATSTGRAFTDFEVDGVKFSDFVGKGQFILVDFWASWCRPCKEQIPFVKSVYEKYHGADFDVLSVAVWDKPEDTEAAAKESGIVWNQMINTQTVATDAYGIESIPEIILFGPDGTILKRGLFGSDIEEAVKEALGR